MDALLNPWLVVTLLVILLAMLGHRLYVEQNLAVLGAMIPRLYMASIYAIIGLGGLQGPDAMAWARSAVIALVAGDIVLGVWDFLLFRRGFKLKMFQRVGSGLLTCLVLFLIISG